MHRASWKAKNPLLEKKFEYTMKSSDQDYLTFESKVIILHIIIKKAHTDHIIV
jgi:hypothetical protein